MYTAKATRVTPPTMLMSTMRKASDAAVLVVPADVLCRGTAGVPGRTVTVAFCAQSEVSMHSAMVMELSSASSGYTRWMLARVMSAEANSMVMPGSVLATTTPRLASSGALFCSKARRRDGASTHVATKAGR